MKNLDLKIHNLNKGLLRLISFEHIQNLLKEVTIWLF